MDQPEGKEFTVVEGLALTCAFVGAQLSSELIASWGTYYYSPTADTGRIIYVGIGLVGFVFMVGRIFDFITDPLIGMWSDKTRTEPGRWRLAPIAGRRRPFIFWGSVCMTGTAIAFWHPPVASESAANFFYATVVICLHWGFYTVAYVALLALGPEIARSEQGRVKLGVYVGVGLLLGLAISQIVPGIVIATVGFHHMGIGFALCALALFQLPVWLVRERYHSSAHPERVPARTELRALLENRALLAYFMAFYLMQMGLLAVQRVVPYWAEVGLGGDERTVSVIMLPFIGMAALTLPLVPRLARVIPLKWLFLACIFLVTSGLPFMYVIAQYEPEITTPSPLLEWWMGTIGIDDPAGAVRVCLAAVMFGWAGIGQGLFYLLLTPLIGEIIDYDEQKTGERREALFNGISGFAIKTAQAVGILLATQSMNLFGNSHENPLGILLVGPLGGLLGGLALVAASFYPVLHVTPERADAFSE